ncbi:alkanesulfonate monooxygenase SsuD/methylene tetrahydromethanopterin reductase-like flavin-dependent oxidoreductase (luciferase family) [Humitalea rosea]|uniref:Alkanesulfonate monooxygenase SsuD/methylene tetrahydromethanopterin reductase-like flavin-dependent oxidoreductase (Luciferase family) n=1 Tax=Humitalea rosea TaxID=990373 RepID=A0A2W7ICY7_9PROT|nr:LLM class flavin-dependent oxidoreductase [Humitalea rosea]PZW44826.1 alkanesulfonate monooxygenase SsuD/methylene tetrahydromethanopterin reductase-like flavin-dependent oxidoreductase (luciferase family) [Humitalea rosea]
MQIALFNLMAMHHPDQTPAEVLATTVEHVRLAERLGFDAAWFAEHHFSNASVCPSPLLMVAHCAAVTQRIALGPAVIVLPLNNPLRIVQELGMLDALTGGRLLLGLGTGHQPHEFRTYGVDIGNRSALLQEGWDILQQGLTTGRVAHDGRYITVPAAPLAATPGRMPPLFLAGGDAGLLERAARSGATPLVGQGFRTAQMTLKSLDPIRSAYAAAGIPMERMPLGLQRYIFVTDDAEEAREAARGLLRMGRILQGLRLPDPPRDGVHLRDIPLDNEPSEAWLLENCPIGRIEHVTQVLAEDLRLLRPTHMSIYTSFTTLPRPAVLRALERLGTEVLPFLRREAMPLRLAV